MSLEISGNVLNRKGKMERMSNGFMELVDAELNYIYFEMNSDNASNKSDF